MNSVFQTPGHLQNVVDLEPPSFLADSSDIDVERQVPPLNLTENRFPEKQDTPEKDVDSVEDQQSNDNTAQEHAPQCDREIAIPIFTPVIETLKKTENERGNNGSPCLTPVLHIDGHAGKLDTSCREFYQLIKPLPTN